MPERHVALLRAINLGGHNKLPMADLRALFTDLGCADVRTYIQSGNVVYQPPKAAGDDFGARVADAIDQRFGLKVPVIVRRGNRLAELAEKHPLAQPDDSHKALYVGFLSGPPQGEIDPERSPQDTVQIDGHDLYLRYPQGVARSKLTNAYLDRALGVVSTLRNWRTVQTLAEWAMG
ncbi:MAG: DUF1697 domain-containing protein [Myxococcales bacterium]|nr:DUF1697 domain-containing protein [Myxococcales bacterium]MCB9539923.1 DUF1697 domain-containing protein [Myxococcales bacterium]